QGEAHEPTGAREGIADYHIKSIQPDGSRVPAPDRDEHFPVFYGATGPLDSPAYGLDINDGGLRQRALETARDEDRLTASSNFSLRGNRVGFLMVAPVYRPGAPHVTVPERREHLIGVVHAFVEISSLLESIINTAKIPGLDLYFFPPARGEITPPGAFHFDGARARM